MRLRVCASMRLVLCASVRLCVCASSLLAPTRGFAQERAPVRREIPGFDFRPDGVWRRQARAVRARRAALLAQGAFATLNAPMAAGGPNPSAQAPSAILKVPVVLFQYQNISAAYAPAQYDAVLFSSPTPPFGRPYTYRTFYQQLSNNLLDIQGQTYGPATLDSNEVTYTGAPPCSGSPFPGGTSCNGLFDYSGGQTGPSPVARMQGGLRRALRKVDSLTTAAGSPIDWAQYDSDGDGVVDLVVFVQPGLDGACGPAASNHLWSHRYLLVNAGQTAESAFVTSTPWPGHAGQFIRVLDYVLQSGLGGASSCDGGQIMPVGTVAHETGHGFGLPDLYDTGGETEGVGRWSLMGTGNYSSPLSPARMDAWSLNELGWVTLAPLTGAGAYGFGAAPTADSVFLVRPTGSNARGEYFLLENRQAVQADTALIRNACQVWYQDSTRTSCSGGMLIWHVDSQQVVNGSLSNEVNHGPIHGLELLQADGRANLDADPSIRCDAPPPAQGCSDRGDAGDPYPGILLNTTLTFSTPPSNALNTGACSGFRIDTISQVALNGAMRFVLGSETSALTVTTAPQLPAGQWG